MLANLPARERVRQDVQLARREKPEVPRASRSPFIRPVSGLRPLARHAPASDAADATARRRILLAPPPAPRRSPVPGARRQKRCAGGLGMAARRYRGRPRNLVPCAAGAIS